MPSPISSNPPTATPAPMPALAPVLSPLEPVVAAGSGAEDVMEAPAAAVEEEGEGEGVVTREVDDVDGDSVDVAEVDVVEDEDEEEEEEEEEDDDNASLDCMINPGLESCPSTQPEMPESSAPVGSLMRRTKFGLDSIAASSMLSFSPIVHV
ncbi:uncharacterized protein Z520_05653 [Fonsecaea multimorphosa CBS 102226]|uniref:Uncharacterized protein n=1 Tax=Fonsecaea multimorphosa CBS 102226 TaxID=1442371 RepID=A0A0D2JXV0_9EURO|nr:uncharacterized protein Z520_05653 [Fonsecaea multimorphosa CBS 102226]KIX98352.1 hypothetical protein Z520_05653 [Fonsecaea multimorphosa CBS 102226]